MAAWPASLPCLMHDAQETRQDGSIRTDMSAGPQKARRRFSAVSRAVTVTLVLSPDQRSVLDTFYAETLAEGSLSFDVADPFGGSLVAARFSGPISYTFRGHRGAGARWYFAAVSLEILP